MDVAGQLLIALGTIVAAVVAAVVVGRASGLRTVESRTDVETDRLIAALERRIKVLTDDLKDAQEEMGLLLKEVEKLRDEIVKLRRELDEERRITARINGLTGAQGKESM